MSETEGWITTSCDIPTTVENLDFIEEKLKNHYKVTDYMLAMENDPKEHIHMVGFAERKNWDNFVKSLVDKWKLTATGHGGLRHYATLKKQIRSSELLMTYCTKQSEGDFENTIRTNLDPIKVAYLHSQSYTKEKKNKLRDDIHEYLEKQDHLPYASGSKTHAQNMNLYCPGLCDAIIMDLKYNIINYLRITKDINVSRTLVNTSLSFHLKTTSHYEDIHANWLLYHINK